MATITSKYLKKIARGIAIISVFIGITGKLDAQTDVDNIKRGIVAVKNGSSGIYVGWRLLGNDPDDIAFNLYRITDGGTEEKLNDTPISGSTNYFDQTAQITASNEYYVVSVINDIEQQPSDTAGVWSQNYLNIHLQKPASGITADGGYSYEPNDASVADLDGDGEYEIIIKWYPSNAKDNSQSGYTGNMILDAYELNGTQLWRIDFGINVRSGAHYGPYMVYDLDGDGMAEVVARTAPGSKDGSGQFLSDGPAAGANHNTDYRNPWGYILTGDEYLTVFRGTDGRELKTINLEPDRGKVTDWGDDYGNRVDRFLGAVAYLDGQHPSVLWCRGIYTKVEIAAYDWDGTDLTQRWIFKSQEGYDDWSGMGSHNLSVGDIDLDGRDEIVYGHCAIDEYGKGLWSLKSEIGTSTGDAMHLADMIPERPGLERWACGEHSQSGSHLVDAASGEIIWKTPAADVGRATAGDLVKEFYGMEVWGGTDGLRSSLKQYAGPWPSSTNHVVWWDADLGRELLNDIYIDKYQKGVILAANGCYSNNGSKANPCLQADIFGDWREEVIWRTTDNNNIRIYTTTDLTDYRIQTLMHDRQYRLAIAWQNNSYNQPPHTSYYLGYDMFSMDKVPPSSPANLTVEPRYGFFNINWTANQEYDLKGYNIYKSVSGSEFVKLNDIPLATSNVKDSMVSTNVLYKYFVTAMDTDGNESSPSLKVIGFATYRPDAPSNIKTSIGNEKNLIYWDPVGSKTLKSAKVDNLVLKHAYTFADGTATDTVSGADGTVIGGKFEDGTYVANANGQYIVLPAGDIAINTYSSVTIEAYIHADKENTEANMFCYFGGNVNGAGGNGFFMTPDRWTESRTAISCGNLSQPWKAEQGVTGSQVSIGNEHHLVSVLTDSTISLFIDGNLIGKSKVSGNNTIKNLSNTKAWLCKGGYNADPTWMGRIQEFNIYEGIMDESTVVQRSVNWPDDNAIPGTGTVIGYNIYGSVKSGLDFEKVNTELINDTAFIHENLDNGTTYYYLVTTVDDGLKESYYPGEVHGTPLGVIVLQAEEALYVNAGVEWIHDGFNGAGYLNFEQTGFVQFNHVYSRDEGWYKLRIRQALGDISRTGELVVNGAVKEYTMENTGDWTNYEYMNVPVHLNAEFNNAIRLNATGNGFGNLDEIIIGIKTAAPTGISVLYNDDNQTLKAYPNPFNSFTNIDLQYSGKNIPGIEIYNIYGQKVRMEQFEKIGPDYMRCRFKATGLASGIYIATVSIDGNPVKSIKLVHKNKAE